MWQFFKSNPYTWNIHRILFYFVADCFRLSIILCPSFKLRFLLLLSRNRSCDNRIPFYSQKEIGFLPYYRYLCQVRTVHAPLSVCACVGNWVFCTLLGLSCVKVRSKAKGAWGWRPCSSSSSSFSSSLAVSSGSVRSGASSQISNLVKIAKSCHAALNPTYFCCSPSLASRFSLHMILEYLFSTCPMSVPTSAIQFALYCPVKKTHLTRFWKSATMTRDALMLDCEITEYEQHLVY